MTRHAARTWLRPVIVTIALAGGDGCSRFVDSSTAPARSATGASTRSPGVTRVGPPAPGHWARHRVNDAGRGVDVYIAHDARPKPVLILIQGSGCAPLMTLDPDGTFHDTSLFQDLIPARLDTLHVVMVDKRGIEPLRFAEGMSRRDKTNAFERAGRECSAEYLRNVTKQARVQDVVATIRALARQPWARQIILAGHSEGTHVVTGVLREMKGPDIAASGLFASAGPTPFYGGYVARGAGNRDGFESVFDRIRMLQRADDDFMYEGLPARRWKTFWLDSTPIDDVRDSTVPLFIAQGSRDDTTLPADLFTLEAIRQQPNRPLRYVVVEGGDHAFDTPDGRSHLADLFDDFVRWALDEHRQTGLAVLK